MKAAGVVQMYQNSEKYNKVGYISFTGDGDCKVFNGVEEMVNRYQLLNKYAQAICKNVSVQAHED